MKREYLFSLMTGFVFFASTGFSATPLETFETYYKKAPNFKNCTVKVVGPTQFQKQFFVSVSVKDVFKQFTMSVGEKTKVTKETYRSSEDLKTVSFDEEGKKAVDQLFPIFSVGTATRITFNLNEKGEVASVRFHAWENNLIGIWSTVFDKTCTN